jgi:hypothetical protein
MTVPRRTQHRPQRDSKETKASELAEIRKENQALRRQIARLNREYRKVEGLIPDESPEPAETPPPLVEEQLGGCPQCHSTDFGTVKMGTKTITVCKECKFRSVA